MVKRANPMLKRMKNTLIAMYETPGATVIAMVEKYTNNEANDTRTWQRLDALHAKAEGLRKRSMPEPEDLNPWDAPLQLSRDIYLVYGVCRCKPHL